MKGYLILAEKQFKNPKKYSGAWNFGTRPNSLTSVKSIVNFIIKFWGKGRLKIKRNKLYEQENLQLNINKAIKYLNWHPTYNIKESVRFTTEWYLKVLEQKKKSSSVTLDQIVQYEKDSKIS